MSRGKGSRRFTPRRSGEPVAQIKAARKLCATSLRLRPRLAPAAAVVRASVASSEQDVALAHGREGLRLQVGLEGEGLRVAAERFAALHHRSEPGGERDGAGALDDVCAPRARPLAFGGRNRLLALVDDEPEAVIVGRLLDRALIGAAFCLPADAALQ